MMLSLFRQPMILAVLIGGALLSTNSPSAQASDGVAAAGCNNCANCRAARGRHGNRLGRRGGRSGRGGNNGCVNCRPYQYGQPDLFYNFYTPGTCGGVPASMYPAPLSTTPQHVGHTYYTYQPFMPHEMMYRHSRGYHRYYDGGRGLTRTRVTYW